MKNSLFRFFDAFIWIPKLIFVWILLCFVNVEAAPMTCADWGTEARVDAEARDARVMESALKLVSAQRRDTPDDALLRKEILEGVYHNPSLKDAAPETVGNIARLVCEKNGWAK